MPDVSTFYLIRHGANDFVGHTLAGRLPNVHLNAEGKKQVRRLAERLAQVDFHRVISSPLERARETAFPLAEALGLQVDVDAAFVEVNFGDWTGKTVAELSSDPLWKNWNAYRTGARIPNGESMLEIQQRAVAALLDLHQKFPEQRIAIVSHGDVIRAILLHFLGMSLDLVHRLEISPASFSVVALHDNFAQVLAVNSTC